MAKTIKLRTDLRFSFASFAEFSSVRTTAVNFATNNNGTARFYYKEDPTKTDQYSLDLALDFTPANETVQNQLQTVIENALKNLPGIIERDGKFFTHNIEIVGDEIPE